MPEHGFALRLATAALRMTPSFWVLGALHSGAARLFDGLARHPDILPPLRRGTRVPATGWPVGKPVAWYRAHFPLRRRARQGAVTGDATPGALFDPAVAARIAAVNPEARLIAVLRNPVDRAVLHYLDEVRAGRETSSLEAAVLHDDERQDAVTPRRAAYRRRGEYPAQIRALLGQFHPSRLLVLTSDELEADPEAVTLACCGFLGLPVPTLPLRCPDPPERTGIALHPPLRRRLDRHFAPHNRALETLLDRRLPW